MDLVLPGWIKHLREWLRKLLSKPAVEISPRKPNRPKTAVINREDEGAFFYLKDILDQLSRSQRMLKRVRKIDVEAYNYHRRVGAKVLPAKVRVGAVRVSDLFLKSHPSLGMVYFFSKKRAAEAAKDDMITSSFCYFQKIKYPLDVEPSMHAVYKLVIVHDDGTLIHGTCGFFEVKKDGKVRLLRQVNQHYHKFKGSRHRDGFMRRTWGLPSSFRDLWEDNKKKYAIEFETLEQYSVSLFVGAVNAFCLPGTDELQVRCRKSDIVSMFNVSTKRTPYFFKDRDTTIASDGKRKRIFHIVRAHSRYLANGRISEVKEHYRGERKFTWDGHKIFITVPGLHHADLNAFNIPSYDSDNMPDGLGKTLSFGKLGTVLAESMES